VVAFLNTISIKALTNTVNQAHVYRGLEHLNTKGLLGNAIFNTVCSK